MVLVLTEGFKQVIFQTYNEGFKPVIFQTYNEEFKPIIFQTYKWRVKTKPFISKYHTAHFCYHLLQFLD